MLMAMLFAVVCFAITVPVAIAVAVTVTIAVPVTVATEALMGLSTVENEGHIAVFA